MTSRVVLLCVTVIALIIGMLSLIDSWLVLIATLCCCVVLITPSVITTGWLSVWILSVNCRRRCRPAVLIMYMSRLGCILLGRTLW